MNDESIKLILQELRKSFPSSNFSFSLRVVDTLFVLTLMQDARDQINNSLFVQADGTSLAEAQKNLSVAIIKFLTSKRDEMNNYFVQETSRVGAQNNIYNQCIFELWSLVKESSETKPLI